VDFADSETGAHRHGPNVAFLGGIFRFGGLNLVGSRAFTPRATLTPTGSLNGKKKKGAVPHPVGRRGGRGGLGAAFVAF